MLGGVAAAMVVDNLVIADKDGNPLAPPDYQVAPEVSNLDQWRLKMLRSMFEEQ